jgi:hypothetical protein
MTPIDERLRTGLAANTDHLVPDLARELAATYDRARGRRRARRGALALAVAAAVAVTAWIVELPELDGDVVPPVTPHPTPRDLDGVVGKLDPGTYSLAAWGETDADLLPRAIIDVPEGFWSNGGYVIDAGQSAFEPEELGALQVYAVDQVLTDPCRRPTATDIGPTTDDLARALVAARGPSTHARAATLDGRDALYLTITVPTDTDLTTCTDRAYSLWVANGDAQAHSDPGVVHHVWILDVDQTRLAVVASLYPDQDPDQNRELLAMAESIDFAPPGS